MPVATAAAKASVSGMSWSDGITSITASGSSAASSLAAMAMAGAVPRPHGSV